MRTGHVLPISQSSAYTYTVERANQTYGYLPSMASLRLDRYSSVIDTVCVNNLLEAVT